MISSDDGRATAHSHDLSSGLTWRRAAPDDAEQLMRIYNQSVDGGGRSPTLGPGKIEDMRYIIERGGRSGWPTWVVECASPEAPDLSPAPVAWAHLRTISWAPQACRSTGDLWLYVDREWHGTGLAMRMARRVGREARAHGFDTLTCWILSSNRRSLSLVRACRLKRWALMPQVVDYGGLRFDLEVWGCKLDDPEWISHMRRLDRRYAGLARVRANASVLASSAESAIA